MASTGGTTFFTEVVSRRYLLTTKLRSAMDGKEIRNLTVAYLFVAIELKRNSQGERRRQYQGRFDSDHKASYTWLVRRVRVNSENEGEL